ncbi:MAG TPA: hypothetical protein VFH06_00215 [Candidatus Saccharimonadales bacterium]|nr:hypothetical protein [Candidatus Saccharimonadales bacterium]
MAEQEEVQEVLRTAQSLVVANYRLVMTWFEKAVQVRLRYEMELDRRARRFIVGNMEEVWGSTPFYAPSLTPPGAHCDEEYVNWVMSSIMYLLDPKNDDYSKWSSHAFIIMNECREHLGLPKLEQISA